MLELGVDSDHMSGLHALIAAVNVQRCDGEVGARIHVGDQGAAANRCWRWSVRRSVSVVAMPYDA